MWPVVGISPFFRRAGREATVPIGNIFSFDNDDFDSGNFDAPVGSGTITFGGTKLSLSGGNGTFTNYVAHPWRTGLQNSKIPIHYKITHVPGASTFGLGFGFESINPSTPISARAYLVCSSGGLLGNCILNVDGVDTISATAIPIAQNDLIRTTGLFRTPYGYDITYTNETQGGSCSASETVSTTSASNSPRAGNTSKIALYPLGGSYEVYELSYAPVGMSTRADAFLVADSKGSYCATTQSDRTVDLLNAAGKTAYLNGGTGDGTAEVEATLPELALMDAKNYFIDVVCNDLRNAVPAGTWQAALTNIHSTLETGSRIVWCITPSCENPLDVTPAVTWISANIDHYLDMYALTSLGATNPDPTYVDADDIHLTDAGMTLKKNLILPEI